MKIEIVKHTLSFKTPAQTSRNTFKNRDVYYIIKSNALGVIGMGEAAPLQLLSIDDVEDYESVLKQMIEEYIQNPKIIGGAAFDDFPSIRFGLEGMEMFEKYARNSSWPFGAGGRMEINGLVWMDSIANMTQQAIEKYHKGFRCIKFKVGAQDFDAECRMIEQLRKSAGADVEIRLDANGAFDPDDALLKLKEFKRFQIHSIEQPIQPKQWEAFQEICAKTPVPIALDEELIPIKDRDIKAQMLDVINPQYIILKPNLMGGFKGAEEWISLAENRNINWWATSALESNIGLFAIAQWVGAKKVKLPQGLGTGSLYINNVESPLLVDPPYIKYQKQGVWGKLDGTQIAYWEW